MTVKTQLYVWDLHGTLERGNEQAVVELSNRVLQDFGLPYRFTPKMGVDLYGLKWHQYFRSLIPDISDQLAYELQEACFKLSLHDTEIQLRSIRRTPHAARVLDMIGRCQEQVLVSNTREDTLPLFLHRLGLNRYFAPGRYMAVDNHSASGATKTAVVLEILAKAHYDEVIVIGDSESDMQMARAVNAVGVLFNHPYLRRKRCAADCYTSDLRDVLGLLAGCSPRPALD